MLHPALRTTKARHSNPSIGEDVDRRSSVRYALRLPVLFQQGETAIGEQQGAGFTRDMSTTGAYIMCEKEAERPTLSSSLTIQVLIPSLTAKSPGMRLTGVATVVRTSAPNEEPGFAVAGEFGHELEEPDCASAEDRL
jgi:hypothetical protein